MSGILQLNNGRQKGVNSNDTTPLYRQNMTPRIKKNPSAIFSEATSKRPMGLNYANVVHSPKRSKPSTTPIPSGTSNVVNNSSLGISPLKMGTSQNEENMENFSTRELVVMNYKMAEKSMKMVEKSMKMVEKSMKMVEKSMKESNENFEMVFELLKAQSNENGTGSANPDLVDKGRNAIKQLDESREDSEISSYGEASNRQSSISRTSSMSSNARARRSTVKNHNYKKMHHSCIEEEDDDVGGNLF